MGRSVQRKSIPTFFRVHGFQMFQILLEDEDEEKAESWRKKKRWTA
jgi:hypothetical protein